jgi:hypothetical protein
MSKRSSSRRSVSKALDSLDPEVFFRMQSVLKVLGGGGGPADIKRAKPYIEAARTWRARLGEGAAFDPETWAELERIVPASLPGGIQRGG